MAVCKKHENLVYMRKYENYKVHLWKYETCRVNVWKCENYSLYVEI